MSNPTLQPARNAINLGEANFGAIETTERVVEMDDVANTWYDLRPSTWSIHDLISRRTGMEVLLNIDRISLARVTISSAWRQNQRILLSFCGLQAYKTTIMYGIGLILAESTSFLDHCKSCLKLIGSKKLTTGLKGRRCSQPSMR